MSELVLLVFQTEFELMRKKIRNNISNIRLSMQKIHPSKTSIIIHNSKKYIKNLQW